MISRCVILVLLVAVSHAATLNVPAEYSTVNLAVDSSAPGDTVLIAPGSYSIQPIEFQHGLHLVGSSHAAEACTLSVNMQPHANGISDYGMEVFQGDSLSINNITFTQSGESAYSFLVLRRLFYLRIDNCRFTEVMTPINSVVDQTIITRCTFDNNSGELRLESSGAAQGSQILIFHDNTILYHYGTVRLRGSYNSSYSASIRQNVFYHVTGSPCISFGGAGSNTIINNTFYSLNPSYIQGTVFQTSGNIEFYNNILYNLNIPMYGYLLIQNDEFNNNTLTFNYNCTEYNRSAMITNGDAIINYLVNNTTSNPALDFSTDNFFHLQPSSPCIDAGDPSSPLDPDGTVADIGAYYFCQGEGMTVPEEMRLVTEPGYPVVLDLPLCSACDPVLIDSVKTGSSEFNLLSAPEILEAEFRQASVFLVFNSATQGYFEDTLHVWADTPVSNTDDPRHHVIPLFAEAGAIPAPVSDLSISITENLSAQLTWSPVDTTIYGNPVTPDWYLIFYNELDPLVDDFWYYQGATSGTEYTHLLAAQFADVMNYRVVAWKGINPVAAGLNYGETYNSVLLKLSHMEKEVRSGHAN